MMKKLTLFPSTMGRLIPICIALVSASALLWQPSDAFTPIAIKVASRPLTSTLKVQSPFFVSPRLQQQSNSNSNSKLQMGSYEALMEKIPSQTVIQAVQTSSNGKVIASGKHTQH